MAEIAALFATTAGTTAATTAASTAATTASTAAATTAATSAGSSFFSLSNIGSLLNTGFTLASAAGDLFGGYSQGKAASLQLQQQAEQDFLDAKQQELAGKQEQNDIMSNLLQTVASQRLAYSGAGIDLGFGTPAALERNLSRQAEMQFSTSRDNAQIKTLARRRAGYLKQSQRRDAQMTPVIAGVSSAGGKVGRLF